VATYKRNFRYTSPGNKSHNLKNVEITPKIRSANFSLEEQDLVVVNPHTLFSSVIALVPWRCSQAFSSTSSMDPKSPSSTASPKSDGDLSGTAQVAQTAQVSWLSREWAEGD
jgi:hypothetical protein